MTNAEVMSGEAKWRTVLAVRSAELVKLLSDSRPGVADAHHIDRRVGKRGRTSPGSLRLQDGKQTSQMSTPHHWESCLLWQLTQTSMLLKLRLSGNRSELNHGRIGCAGHC